MPIARRCLAMCLAALFFTGCNAGGPIDPPIPDAARGAVGSETASDLAMHTWPGGPTTKAVILALHGFGDAGDLTFRDAADYWATRGITTYAPDQRGFGGNPSHKRWPGAEALAEDAVALVADIRARHPGVPLTVVGHSMGGGVALIAAAQGMDADALALAGPAIAGGDALSPIYRAGGWVMATTVPERRWTGEGLVEIWPTDNIEALIRVGSDPRQISDPSSRELYGLVQVMDKAAAAAHQVTIPTLTLMGANDQILHPDDVRLVHDRIPGAVDFRVYPDGWHWLFRDLQARTVWTEVADFALSVEQSTSLGQDI